MIYDLRPLMCAYVVTLLKYCAFFYLHECVPSGCATISSITESAIAVKSALELVDLLILGTDFEVVSAQFNMWRGEGSLTPSDFKFDGINVAVWPAYGEIARVALGKAGKLETDDFSNRLTASKGAVEIVDFIVRTLLRSAMEIANIMSALVKHWWLQGSGLAADRGDAIPHREHPGGETAAGRRHSTSRTPRGGDDCTLKKEHSDLLTQLMTDFTLHMVWFVRKKTKERPTTVDNNLMCSRCACTSDCWAATSTSTSRQRPRPLQWRRLPGRLRIL